MDRMAFAEHEPIESGRCCQIDTTYPRSLEGIVRIIAIVSMYTNTKSTTIQKTAVTIQSHKRHLSHARMTVGEFYFIMHTHYKKSQF